MNTRGIRRLLWQPQDWLVSLSLARTLTPEDHLKTFVLNAAAGIAITLPKALGSGTKFTLLVGTAISSNTTTVKVQNTVDIIQGLILGTTDTNSATINLWAAGASDDTITLDGSTRGGFVGDRIDLVDMKSGVWQVTGWMQSSGTEATPFSATV